MLISFSDFSAAGLRLIRRMATMAKTATTAKATHNQEGNRLRVEDGFSGLCFLDTIAPNNRMNYPHPPPLGLRLSSSLILGVYSSSYSCGLGFEASYRPPSAAVKL